jgi:hypothetical protein
MAPVNGSQSVMMNNTKKYFKANKVQTSKGRTLKAHTASDHPLPVQLALNEQPTLMLPLGFNSTRGSMDIQHWGSTPERRMLKWKLRIYGMIFIMEHMMGPIRYGETRLTIDLIWLPTLFKTKSR